ncbi:MAG: fibrillarin-like rRNA/tRNA 2'-O-methyltransferase [Thermoplasmata archaeon]|nr:fibrillarin-like rRNA/tRNA 2'-O-methyltransferase [Thermoplasmata archaeon]
MHTNNPRGLSTLSLETGEKRPWRPDHSKLAALLLKGKNINLEGIERVLYLGGGHGTTVSHLSDILPNARIFVVEFGPSIQKIIHLARNRPNILPIMEDAAVPKRYRLALSEGPMDLLYQDVAQRNQIEIIRKNLRFLKQGGRFMLMLKVRSIEQERNKREVAEDALSELRGIPGLIVEGWVDLAPYQREHYAFWGILQRSNTTLTQAGDSLTSSM